MDSRLQLLHPMYGVAATAAIFAFDGAAAIVAAVVPVAAPAVGAPASTAEETVTAARVNVRKILRLKRPAMITPSQSHRCGPIRPDRTGCPCADRRERNQVLFQRQYIRRRVEALVREGKIDERAVLVFPADAMQAR